MKKLFLIHHLNLLTTIVLLLCCSAFMSTTALKWEKLGTRVVNYSLDRDEIPVSLREGTFNSVKLVVNRSPLQIHRFVVHFSNGAKQEVLVRKRIPKGGATRIIDLKGGNRGIKKVVFWYDTGKLARGKSIVELWGRH